MLKIIIKHVLIVFITLSSLQSNAFALGYEGVRDSSFDTSEPSYCDTGDMGTFGIGMFSDNEDVRWVLSNPTCYGFIIGLGVSLQASAWTASAMCREDPIAFPYTSYGPGTDIPPAAQLDPSMATKFALLGSTCALRVGQAATASSAYSACTSGTLGIGAAACNPVPMGAANASATRCCQSYGVFAGVVSSALLVLGILFETAKLTYENARVCGYDWYSWQRQNVDGSPDGSGVYWRRGSFPSSKSYSLQKSFADPTSTQYCGRFPEGATNGLGILCKNSLDNQDYREYFYGGIEVEDRGGDCRIPTSWSEDERKERLGYNSDDNYGHNQVYYMKGPGLASNYACYRYLSTGSRQMNDDEQAAFDCCVGRSKSTMCIDSKSWPLSNHESKFCKLGETCVIDTVGFKIDSSKSQMNVICAQTDTLCPYDHLLGGGTEEREIDNSAERMVISGRVNNYCQFNKHCVKVPGAPYVRINDFDSAFISGACMDFVGHSQNVYDSDTEILPVTRIKNFSAPLIECMAETMKNVVQNRAGHTMCANPDESPRGPLNVCGDNVPEDYLYKEGDQLETQSIFQTVRDFLSSAVKLVLVLSVVILGYGILIGAKPIERKRITIYLVKFACVMYFAVGTGWNDLFIDNVFKISSSISSLVMRMEDDTYAADQLDGCQFPKFNGNSVQGRMGSKYIEPSDDPYYTQNISYTEGFDYLRPWDILDCKFVRSIGFGPDLSVPNLVLTIFAGLLTGGLGIVFVMFTFIFAFFYIAMIIRGLHIFLVSIISITLLIFISPITITAIMFEKTKSIFNSWLKQLFGFIIQPVILFAYIALFIVIIDYAALGIRAEMNDRAVYGENYNGGITFSGSGLAESKLINCDGDALDNSLYCIFGFARFGTFSGLEPIGILLPFIFDFNASKLDTIIKSGLLLFIFSQFMDKISDLAGQLTGSSTISSSTPSAGQIAGKAYGVASGVTKRGTRVAKRGVMAVGRKGKSLTRAAFASKPKGPASNSGTVAGNSISNPSGSSSTPGSSGPSSTPSGGSEGPGGGGGSKS